MKRLLIVLGVGLIIAGSVFCLLRNHEQIKNNSKEIISQTKQVDYQEKAAKKQARIKGYKEYLDAIRIPFGEDKSPAPSGYLMEEYQKVIASKSKLAPAKKSIEWIERGPINSGGRARAMIVDPDDPSHMTWFLGTASGGVWKTTDGGANWACITSDLPILSTTTLAMAKSNTNVIYMGTGETSTGLTGGCIFITTDKGETWSPLDTTIGDENFRFVNRIEVDPDNDSILLVATDEGIFKSIDAGQSFEMKYDSPGAVEDLVADTSDFNYMYAGVNSYGVVRSVDAGETWEFASEGIGEKQRIELAISPVNTSKIYASIETGNTVGSLYYSEDRGDNWYYVQNSIADDYNLLGQGFYDNAIAAHPYDEDVVFFGGVNLWKATIGTEVISGEGVVSRFDVVNTESFLSFVSFTDNLYPGMNTGDKEEATDLLDSDFTSVEIRFGPGLSQKAHRFTVPEEATSGVPAADYTYQDYVDVPFQVWDVTNNRQLMFSFRDQEADGAFNLYERTGDNWGQLGREYMFVNAVEYDPDNPDPNIATKGGRSYKLLYFFWPELVAGGSWEPDNLPESKIVIDWTVLQKRISNIANVSDAYYQYDGINNRTWSAFDMIGLHPDHHDILMIPVNDDTEEFWVMESNDGGVSLSTDNGVNFTQHQRFIRATQFYDVDKKPYRNEYLGGTQDNGTWQSPINENASLDSAWNHRLGSDGFDVVWHAQDSNKLMASWYNSPILTSTNHGLTWKQDDEFEGLPFWVKLEAVPSNNNIVFTPSSAGVYKTTTFGAIYWRITEVGDEYCPTGYAGAIRVKVSPANEQIVWAGAAMIPDYGWSMYVSSDQGGSFLPVNAPANPVPAYISGFATHPTEENTAYALYSLYGEPKILRTTDLGETWEDITQVNEEGVSENGFPNVGVNCLVVFPDTTDMIWAGTEIGIMESTDNGASWHFLDANLPAVQIYDLIIQDNQVVAGTYGRGIWTYQFGPEVEPIKNSLSADLINAEWAVYPNPTRGELYVELDDALKGDIQLQVYDMAGKVVLSEVIESSATNSKTQLNLSELQKGMYILKLEDEEQVFSRRIVLE